MGRNHLTILLIASAALLDAAQAACCHVEQRPGPEHTTDVNSNRRDKRGSSLLVTYSTRTYSDDDEIRYETSPNPDGSIKTVIKDKRAATTFSPSYSTKPSSAKRDESESSELPEASYVTRTDTTVTAQPVTTPTLSEPAPTVSINDNKAKRHTHENYEQTVGKIHRNAGRPNLKEYTCYCKESECNSKPHCLRDKLHNTYLPVLANPSDRDDYDEDDSENDTSAEEFDEPRYAPSHGYSRNIAQMTEPTKFNIPFANNVNFDQRVIIKRKNTGSKSAYPLYHNSINQALNLPLFDPDVHRYGTKSNAFSQQNNKIMDSKPRKESMSIDSRMQYPYDLKSLDDENCMILNGRIVCGLPSTTMTPINSVETIDLSNDKLIKIHDGRVTDPSILPETENSKHAHDGYQTTKPTAQNSSKTEQVHDNDPARGENPHLYKVPTADITKPQENKKQAGGSQNLPPTQNKEPSYINRFSYKVSDHGSNLPEYENLHVPKSSHDLHRGFKPTAAEPQNSNPTRTAPTTASMTLSSSDKRFKHPGCACNTRVNKPTSGSKSTHYQYAHRYPTQTVPTKNEKYTAYYYSSPHYGSNSYQSKYDAWGKSKFNRDTMHQTMNTGSNPTYDMKNYASDYDRFTNTDTVQDDETCDCDETIVDSDDDYQNSRQGINESADSQAVNGINKNTEDNNEDERKIQNSNAEYRSGDANVQGDSPSKFSLFEQNANVPNWDPQHIKSFEPTYPERTEGPSGNSNSLDHSELEDNAASNPPGNEVFFRTKYESPNSIVNSEDHVPMTQNPSDAHEMTQIYTRSKIESSNSAGSNEDVQHPYQQALWDQRNEDKVMHPVTRHTDAPTNHEFQAGDAVLPALSETGTIEQTTTDSSGDDNQVTMKEVDDRSWNAAQIVDNFNHLHTYPPKIESKDENNEEDKVPATKMLSTDASSLDDFMYTTTESLINVQTVSREKDLSNAHADEHRGFLESVGIRYRHPKSIYSYASDYGNVMSQQSQGRINLKNGDHHSSAHQTILSPMYFTTVHALPFNSGTPYKTNNYATYNIPYAYTNNNFGAPSYQQNSPVVQSYQNYNSQNGVVSQPRSSYNTQYVTQNWRTSGQDGLDLRNHVQTDGQMGRIGGQEANHFDQYSAASGGRIYNDRSNYVQSSLPRSVHSVDDHTVDKSNDSEVLFRGLEKIILDNYNMTESSQKFDQNIGIEGKTHPVDDGSLGNSHENLGDESHAITYNSKIQSTRPTDFKIQKNTEISIQSVDDRPSAAFESNQGRQSSHQYLAVTTNSPTSLSSYDAQTPASVYLEGDKNIPYFEVNDRGEILLRNIVKKVMNNFVPGEAQDLMVNYETVPESVANTEADLHHTILETPVLRRLFSVPDVENMIVDQASTFYSHLTSSGTEVNPHVVKNTFRYVVDQIPPHPTVAPMTRENSHLYNDQWVTERVTTAMTSLSNPQDASTKEVFDRIKNIINESALDEEVVKQPVVKNLIVKTVKHALDKERGVIDEYTIRQAFDLLVQPRAENPKDTPVKYQKANLVPYSEATTAVPEDKVPKVPPIFTERSLIGDTWVSSVKTLTGLQPNAGSAGFNEERRKALLAKLSELEKQQLPADMNNTDNEESTETADIVTTSRYDYPDENLEDDDSEGTYGGPIYESNRKPIKYYSPNDRILEYIKNHQVTPDPSFSMPSPMTFGYTNEYDDRVTTQRANVINTSFKSPTPEGLASTNHYYLVRPPGNGKELSGTRKDVAVPHRNNYHEERDQSSAIHSNNGNLWNLLVDTTTTSLDSETQNPRDENLHNVQTNNGRPDGRFPLTPVRYDGLERQSEQLIENSYLGRLVPIEYPKSSLPDKLRDSDLIWVGDGVRLPLTLRKLKDGTYALTLSDQVCKRFEHKKCPCCVPNTNDGIIVREKRNAKADGLSFTGSRIAESHRKIEEELNLARSSDSSAHRPKRKYPMEEDGQGVEFDQENILEIINKAYKFAKKLIVGEKSERRDPEETPRKSVEIFKSYPKNERTSVIKTNKHPSRVSDSGKSKKKKITIAAKMSYQPETDQYSMGRTPYKYQQYAKEDFRVRKNIEALQRLLHFLKDFAMDMPDELPLNSQSY